jgi:hypothetical protein
VVAPCSHGLSALTPNPLISSPWIRHSPHSQAPEVLPSRTRCVSSLPLLPLVHRAPKAAPMGLGLAAPIYLTSFGPRHDNRHAETFFADA